MKRVSEALQLSVVVEGSRPSSAELQTLQEPDLVFRGIAAEGSVLEELFEARLYRKGLFRFPFYKLKSLQALQRQSAVQDNFHAKSLEVNIPTLD